MYIYKVYSIITCNVRNFQDTVRTCIYVFSCTPLFKNHWNTKFIEKNQVKTATVPEFQSQVAVEHWFSPTNAVGAPFSAKLSFHGEECCFPDKYYSVIWLSLEVIGTRIAGAVCLPAYWQYKSQLRSPKAHWSVWTLLGTYNPLWHYGILVWMMFKWLDHFTPSGPVAKLLFEEVGCGCVTWYDLETLEGIIILNLELICGDTRIPTIERFKTSNSFLLKS